MEDVVYRHSYRLYRYGCITLDWGLEPNLPLTQCTLFCDRVLFSVGAWGFVLDNSINATNASDFIPASQSRSDPFSVEADG